MKKQGLQVSTSKRVTFAIRASDASLGKKDGVSPASLSGTDVSIQTEEARKSTRQRKLKQTATSSANPLPPVRNGAARKVPAELAPVLTGKAGAAVSRRAPRTQPLGIPPSSAGPVSIKTVTSIHRRWSTEPAGKMTKWETMDMITRAQRVKEEEQKQFKLKEILYNVEKALEVVGMSSKFNTAGSDGGAPSWGILVNELHAEFAASYEETYHKRDHIRSTITTFEETVDICHESLDALQEFFNKHLDLRDELVSPDLLEQMIQGTEGLAEEISGNLKLFIGSGNKLVTKGTLLLSAATHILTEQSKVTDADKLPVIDAESMVRDADQWNTSVKAVKKIYDDGVRRAKRTNIRNLLKYNQRQYNQLLKVAESRHEAFSDKQRQLMDIEFRHSNAQRMSDKLHKDSEQLNVSLDHSKKETAEWRHVVTNLNSENDKLIETIKNLRTKIKRLEALVDKEKTRAEALRRLQDSLSLSDADAESQMSKDPVFKFAMELRADQNALVKLTEMQEALSSELAIEQGRTEQLEQIRAKTASLAGTVHHTGTGATGSKGSRHKSKGKSKSKKARAKVKVKGADDTESVDQSSGSVESGQSGIQSTTSEGDSSERQGKGLSREASDFSSELNSEETSTASSEMLSEADMVAIQESMIALVQGFIHFHAHLQACMGPKGKEIHEGDVLDKLTQAATDMLMLQPRAVLGRVLSVIVKYLRRMEKIVMAFYRSYTDEPMETVEEIMSPIADLQKRAQAGRPPLGTRLQPLKQAPGTTQKQAPGTRATKEAPRGQAMKAGPGAQLTSQSPGTQPGAQPGAQPPSTRPGEPSTRPGEPVPYTQQTMKEGQSQPQYEDVGAPEPYYPQDFTLPNILNRMERKEQRAQEEDSAVYHGKLFKSVYTAPEQVMAATRINIETEKMFRYRQARLGPIKIEWSALQDNLRRLNEAMENNQIMEDLYVEATTAILKALEMPDRKLRVFFHRYLAYKRSLEIENNVITILDDEDEALTEVTELSLGMYLEESKDRNRTMTDRWTRTQDVVQAEGIQLNKDLYNVMCRVYTQHGLLLTHPLLKYPARAGLVPAPHLLAASRLGPASRMVAAARLGPKTHLRPILLKRYLAQQRTKLHTEQGVPMEAVLLGSAMKQAAPSDYWSHTKYVRLEEEQEDDDSFKEDEEEQTTLLPRIHVPHVLSYDINKHHIQATRNMRMKTRTINAAVA